MFGTALGLRQLISIILAVIGIALLLRTIWRSRVKASGTAKLLIALSLLIIFSSIDLSEQALFDVFNRAGLQLDFDILNYVFDTIWWLLFAYLIIKVADVFLWKGMLTQDGRLLVPKVLVYMCNIGILAGITMLFSYFVFKQTIADIAALVGSAGIIFAAISYFAKVPIDSAFTGLQINLANIFRIGNRIQVSDSQAAIEGIVYDIGWSHITLKLDNGNNIYIPNSELLKRTVVNLERPTPETRYDLEVTLGFNVPVHEGRSLIENGLKDLDETLLKYEVSVRSFSKAGVTYLIRFWLARKVPYAKALDAIHSALYYKVQKEQGYDLGFGKYAGIHAKFPNGFNMPLEKRIELLKKVSIFASLGEKELAGLAESSIPRAFGPPEKIIRQGEEGDSMFVVAQGSVKIYLRPEAGERIEVAVDKPGDYFGEMALLTGETRGATAVAITDVLLLEIPKSGLRKVLESNVTLAGKIAESVAAIQAKNEQAVEEAQSKTINVAARHKSLSESIRRGVLKFFGLEDQV